MPFALDDFLRLRPQAYHLTDRRNLGSIAADRLLRPARDLLVRAGRVDALRTRRPSLLEIEIDGAPMILKDQRPLVFANAELAPGWSEGDFVEYLNERVYFWPGRPDGPVNAGARLFDAYAAQSTAILRIPTADLVAANPALTPTFCAFNSGAPRMQHGRRVGRGPDLFTSAHEFPRRASEVVELGFRGSVVLPTSTGVRDPSGGWTRLSGADRASTSATA